MTEPLTSRATVPIQFFLISLKEIEKGLKTPKNRPLILQLYKLILPPEKKLLTQIVA